MTYVHAAKAALSVDKEKSQLRLKLEDAYFESRNAEGEVEAAFAGEAEPLVIDLKNANDRKVSAKPDVQRADPRRKSQTIRRSRPAQKAEDAVGNHDPLFVSRSPVWRSPSWRCRWACNRTAGTRPAA